MTISVLYDNDVYLDPIVTSVTWSGDMTQAYRQLNVTLKNTIDGVEQAVNIELGRELRLYVDESEKFRGVIFTHDIDSSGVMNIAAYDENVYLTKNADSRKFSGMTASSIIRQLCAEFDISIGEIADTGFVIPRLILRDKTLWDMMVAALTETRRQTGRRFLISSKDGALYLTERGEKVVDWVLENGVNITGANYSQSIEDMRNAVKVTANEDAKPETGTVNLPPEALDMITANPNVTKNAKSPIVSTVRDDDLIARFGLMQHFDRADGDATKSKTDQLARELLAELSKIKDEATIEALGNAEITSGSAVYVIESMTKIVGGFYVITDSHTWENGVHRMKLTVSGDENLPTMRYEELDDATTEKVRKKKGNGGVNTAALARLDD